MDRIVSLIKTSDLKSLVDVPDSFGDVVRVVIMPQQSSKFDKEAALKALAELDGSCKGFKFSLEDTRAKRLEEKYGCFS